MPQLIRLVLLFILISSPPLFAEQVKVTAESSLKVGDKDEAWRYLLHLPDSYQSEADKLWPLLIFLHGRSIRGRDLDKVKRYGPPQFLDQKPDFPFIVVSPQLPDGSWPAKALVDLLDEIVSTYHCDKSRIYLTGTSLGAMGAWGFAAEAADRFAAFAPVCGYGWPSLADKLTGLPIRAFHGDADKIVSIDPHRALIEKIRTLGNPEAELITIPGGTHSSVIVPVYEDESLYAWFLKHRNTD